MIFFFLFCFFGAVHSASEVHRLHYIYTAFSKPASQPGMYQFTAMGILDDRPIDIYNSKDQVKIPLQEWMEDNNGKDYWEKGTHSRRSKEQWFNVNVNILIERMRQNKSDLHTLQWMHGCEATKRADGTMKFLKGFDQYGYDGKDFLSFDNKDAVWVATEAQAEPTKKKWDNVGILSQYTKGYLETDCVDWLQKFTGYQEKQDKEHGYSLKPKVYVFGKKSSKSDHRTLVCLATGFYPKDVEVTILRNDVELKENDGVVSSGVRPNGDRPGKWLSETFQLRKTLEIVASDPAKYSCKVQHRSLSEPIHQVWDGKCCNCSPGSTGGIIAGVLVGLAVLVGVGAVVLYKLFKRRQAIPLEGISVGSGPLENQPLAGEEPTPTPNGSLGSNDSGLPENQPLAGEAGGQ
ncbi:class I histocompatibility antigen, F10 alpha chain-like isoform X1 [Conger conger]|uniref:class I histocompatibility antigen, F10 alpha chain-like isoform X1 n=1 Tax=Conger conger TaxID=82655 RepID=UPI002A59DB95|nr:class I histocompatibility antigen, F10 alpha chain-like isoform X1 [Conger conger]